MLALANTDNNYSVLRAVAACAELVLRYIIFCGWKYVSQLHYCIVTDVPTSCCFKKNIALVLRLGSY